MDIRFTLVKPNFNFERLTDHDFRIWLKAQASFELVPELLDVLLFMLLNNRGDLIKLYFNELFTYNPRNQKVYQRVFNTYINMLEKSKYKGRSYLAIYQSIIFMDFLIHYPGLRIPINEYDKETFRFYRAFSNEYFHKNGYKNYFITPKILSLFSFKMFTTGKWMDIVSLDQVESLTEIIKEMFFKLPFDKYKNLPEWEKEQIFNKFKLIHNITKKEIPIQWQKAYLRTDSFYVKEKNRLNELSNFVNNNKFDECFKAKFYILINMFENTYPFDTKSFITENLNIKLETIALNFEQISLNTEECWSLLAMEAAIMLYFMINTSYLVLTNEFINKLENKGIYLKDLEGNYKFLYTKPLYPIPLSKLSEEFWDLEMNKRNKMRSDMNKIITKRLQDKKNESKNDK